MGKGTHIKVELANVRGSRNKTVSYLKNFLPSLHSRARMIVFLGEAHNNDIDKEVAQAILDDPPISIAHKTRVIFERGLSQKYVAGQKIDHEEEEPRSPTSIKARNALIGDLVLRAVDPDQANDEMIYIVCGSEHGLGIFSYLDAKMREPFTYAMKPSDTEK